MTTPPFARLALAALTVAVLPAAAQETAPPGLADAEMARTRACVPGLGRLAAVSADLEPLTRRAERIRSLAAAVTLEDTTAAAPFDATDPLDAAVQAWFAADQDLAERYLAAEEEAILEQRREGREAVLQQLRDALEELGDRGQQRVEAEEDLGAVAARCEDAILVRTVALEVCDDAGDNPVCREARSPAPGGRYRFVEGPGDLWDVESLRPWTDPSRLGRAASGGIGGARTSAVTRRGNLVLGVGVEPLIQSREVVEDEVEARMDAALDSMGVPFEHPALVMAPALAVRLDVPARLDGETHYLLHFGDLSDPANQVVWSGRVSGSPVDALVPVGGAALRRLAAGEALSLTAARLPEGGDGEGEAVFTLTLPTASQARAVGGLLTYMAGGQLDRDLRALVPPPSPAG